MVDACYALTGRWTDGAEIDVADAMMRLTLSIVGRTLFDVDVDADAEWVGRALAEANHQAVTESTRLAPIPIAWPTLGRLRDRAALSRLNRFVYRLIEGRRRTGAAGADVLSLLVGARDEDDGRALTDVEIRDEIMTLFFAGHETTASLLSWAWAFLDAEPGVRTRLEDELSAVLDGRRPTFADLEGLPFAAQVLDETMRLRPPVYAIGRIAERDVMIGDVQIPAGTTVGVNVYGIHRLPGLFDEPERFSPERMAVDRKEALPRGAYMPFGAGPRVCIGAHFAVMEAQLLLAATAQRWRLERVIKREPRARPLITLRPEPFHMRIAASR